MALAEVEESGITRHLAARELPARSLPSECLVATISALLAEQDLPASDLAALCVGTGPGSFTGLRVALSTAKGIALGAGLPLYGISSLQILAVTSGPGLCAIAADNRRGTCYTALFDVDERLRCTPLLNEALRGVDEFAAAVSPQVVDTSVALVGDCSEQLAAKLPSRVSSRILPDLVPNIGDGITSIAHRLASRDADDAITLTPNYLRRSAAEESAAVK